MTFLTVDHPDAFVDFPIKAMPRDRASEGVARDTDPRTFQCPKCKGHGGWNLALNCYPLVGKNYSYPDTPEGRHERAHFRAGCSHCNGWGWVEEKDATHIHDMQHVAELGRCLNRYRCSICGKLEDVDSSDCHTFS